MYLHDPLQKERRPVLTDNGDVEEIGERVRYQKRAYDVVKDAAAKHGYALKSIPVIHRSTGSTRVWDLKNPGYGAYAEQLCSVNWRIATPDEFKAFLDRNEVEKRLEARKRLKYDEAALNKLAHDRTFQSLVDLSGVDAQTAAEMTPEEISALELLLKSAKAKAIASKQEKK